jgi:transposase
MGYGLFQTRTGAGVAHVAEHLSLAELQAGCRTSGDATLARHYQVIWLLAQGRSCVEAARLTSFAWRWIERLLARYNAFGPSSLGDRRRGNGAKPTLLTPEMLAQLRERLKTPPDDGGVWTAKKAAAVMAAELGLAKVAEQRGWEALQAIGWTIQRPRPRHVRAATPEEQVAFKKTSPKRSPRRPRATRTPSSRPSPPTSIASG